MTVCVCKVNVPYILFVADQAFTNMIILNVHMEHIRHHGEVLPVDFLQQGRTLIQVVDEVDLVAVYRLEDQFDTLLFSIVSDKVRHIKKKIFTELRVSPTDGPTGPAYVDQPSEIRGKIDESTEGIIQLFSVLLVLIGKEEIPCCKDLPGGDSTHFEAVLLQESFQHALVHLIRTLEGKLNTIEAKFMGFFYRCLNTTKYDKGIGHRFGACYGY